MAEVPARGADAQTPVRLLREQEEALVHPADLRHSLPAREQEAARELVGGAFGFVDLGTLLLLGGSSPGRQAVKQECLAELARR